MSSLLLSIADIKELNLQQAYEQMSWDKHMQHCMRKIFCYGENAAFYQQQNSLSKDELEDGDEILEAFMFSATTFHTFDFG